MRRRSVGIGAGTIQERGDIAEDLASVFGSAKQTPRAGREHTQQRQNVREHNPDTLPESCNHHSRELRFEQKKRDMVVPG